MVNAVDALVLQGFKEITCENRCIQRVDNVFCRIRVMFITRSPGIAVEWALAREAALMALTSGLWTSPRRARESAMRPPIPTWHAPLTQTRVSASTSTRRARHSMLPAPAEASPRSEVGKLPFWSKYLYLHPKSM